MPSTTPFERGDVVLVPFPFTDLTATKQRPGLVISSNTHNTAREDVVLLAITSQIPSQLGADEMLIPAAELRACGLPKPSVVRATKVVTLHQRLIIKRIGAMPGPTLDQVLALFRAQY